MKHLIITKRNALTAVLFIALQGTAFQVLSHQVNSPADAIMTSGSENLGGMEMMNKIVDAPDLLSDLYSLDVPAEQRQIINQAQDELRDAQWALMPLALEKRSALQAAMADEEADSASIGRVYTEFSNVQRQLLERQIATINQVKSILTAAQKSQVRWFHQASLDTQKGHGMFMDSVYDEQNRERTEMDLQQSRTR